MTGTLLFITAWGGWMLFALFSPHRPSERRKRLIEMADTYSKEQVDHIVLTAVTRSGVLYAVYGAVLGMALTTLFR